MSCRPISFCLFAASSYSDIGGSYESSERILSSYVHANYMLKYYVMIIAPLLSPLTAYVASLPLLVIALSCPSVLILTKVLHVNSAIS